MGSVIVSERAVSLLAERVGASFSGSFSSFVHEINPKLAHTNKEITVKIFFVIN